MLFNVKIIILGFLIYIYRKNKIILEMSKCYIIKWWNVKKYILFSGLVCNMLIFNSKIYKIK